MLSSVCPQKDDGNSKICISRRRLYWFFQALTVPALPLPAGRRHWMAFVHVAGLKSRTSTSPSGLYVQVAPWLPVKVMVSRLAWVDPQKVFMSVYTVFTFAILTGMVTETSPLPPPAAVSANQALFPVAAPGMLNSTPL